MLFRSGRFERADGGTLFLDEVGELSPSAQAKLLRVLQEGEFERLGDTRTRQVDVRLIAATNVDLGQAVQAGQFRADLYYRLNIYPVLVPPLRERTEDIPLLVSRFLDKYNARHGKRIAGITDRAVEALKNYDWPGNIRELQNMIERGVIIVGNGEQIDVKDIFPNLSASAAAEPAPAARAVGGHTAAAPGTPGANGHDLVDRLLSETESLEDLESRDRKSVV